MPVEDIDKYTNYKGFTGGSNYLQEGKVQDFFVSWMKGLPEEIDRSSIKVSEK